MAQRSENSGLIDLDALLREAGTRESAAELPPAPAVVEPAPSVAKVVEAAPVKVAPTDVPQPPSKTKLTDDSLEAVSCEPRTDPWIATTAASNKTAAKETPMPSASPIEAPPPAVARGSYRKGVAIGLALALVAGGVVLLRPRTAAAPQAAPTIVVSPPTEAPKAAAAPPPAESPPIAALSANDLPAAAAASASARARSNAPSGKQGPPADPTKPALLTEADLAPSAAEHGDLGSAMRGAVGPNDKPAAVATSESTGPSASQLHPSQGALVGAIGAVLPTARACLGADDPVRNGLVVFKSDGTVARVELRGSKPEDECVRAALAKAKVAPFVDDTFSTRVTVRP